MLAQRSHLELVNLTLIPYASREKQEEEKALPNYISNALSRNTGSMYWHANTLSSDPT